MTAQDLKNSILQLAVEGKLLKGGSLPLAAAGTPSFATPSAGTPRNAPSDPKTGAELLEQIKAEKARLIAEGKIKKDTTKAGASGRALEPITEDEKPFDIPENWCWCRLGEIFTHNTGKALNQTNKEGMLLEYITTSNLYWDHFELNNLRKMYFTDNEIEKCTIRKGDLLVCEGGEIGRSAIWNEEYEMRIQNHIHKLRPYLPIEIKFFFYVLMLYKNTGLIAGKGIGIQGLSSNVLHNLPIPLSPLAEQKAIVAKIEELIPYIQKYDVAHTKLQEFNKKFPVDMQKSILQQAIMGKLTEDWRNEQARLAKTNLAGQLAGRSSAKDLLEKIKAQKARLITEGKIKKDKPLAEITEDEIPFDIPESWCWCRLGEIGDWGAGATPQRGNPDYYQNGTIPWIKTGELNNGIVSEACEFITEKALNECSIRYNRVGDVLIAMYGATIGKLAIAGIELTTNQACCACTCHNGVYNKYLFYFLMSQKNVFEKKAEGGAQPNISREKIVKTLFPLPPLAEQKLIVAKIEELLPLCKKLVK